MNILDKILETKRKEIAQRKTEIPFEDIHARAQSVNRNTLSFSEALRNSPSGIIAEFKRKSPSKGFFQENADVVRITIGYAENDAAALSMLTDREYFGGSSDDLIRARREVTIPILRKDFTVDPYQICEARLWGADAILLIAAALTPQQTRELARFARSLNLEVLLEIHREEELEHLNACVNIVGINNRNLSTFATHTKTSFDLGAKIPEDFLKISESGIASPETVRALRGAGFRGFLMGENFMKESNPADALGQFIAAL